MIDAMRLAFDDLKLALEPAGAAATAALLGPLRERLAGRRVGVLVCGSNIDLASFAAGKLTSAGSIRAKLDEPAWNDRVRWLDRRIDQGAGREPADLVVRNARILNTATGTLDAGDIAICGDRIVGTLDDLSRPARDRRRRAGSWRPASSTRTSISRARWCCRREFEQGVLPRGTTTAICDPHEIANVLGVAGIRYFLEASESLAMTLRVNLSSCVPATELETSGARLEVADLAAAARPSRGLGLAEVMNFPGVLAKDPASWRSSTRSPAATSTAMPRCCAGCRSTPISPPASAPTTSARCSRRRARSWPRA